MEIRRQPAAPGKQVGGRQAKKHAHKREAFGTRRLIRLNETAQLIGTF
jgi:hypothetical protein